MKLIKKYQRFLRFCIVGGSGALLTFGITWLLTVVWGYWLVASIAIAILATIDICYLLNNYWHIIVKLPQKILRLIKYIFKRELIKFAIVGSIGVAFNFSFLYVLVTIGGANYLLSAALSAICTTIINYTLNHFWTFQTTKIKDNWFRGWLRYKLIDDSTVLIYLGELALFVQVFHMWYLAGAILATIINYPIRYFIIKRVIWEVKKHNQLDASYEWDSYYNGSIFQMWWKHEIANTIWKWIPTSEKILDIGCGSSPISLHYPHIIGLDNNIEKIKFMREKHKGGCYLNTTTQSFKDGSFSNVLCIEVLEHLKNPIEMIAEISRILKVGGSAVIATPDYNKILWRIVEQFTPYKEEHCNNFNIEKLDNVFQKYNLYPVKYKYVAGCDLIEMFVKGDKVNE